MDEKSDVMSDKAHSQQGLAPSQGSVDCTHWSHACLDVVARQAAAAPLRLWLGALVVGGFSLAWHLLMCLESRSLKSGTVALRVDASVDGRKGAHLRAN